MQLKLSADLEGAVEVEPEGFVHDEKLGALGAPRTGKRRAAEGKRTWRERRDRARHGGGRECTRVSEEVEGKQRGGVASMERMEGQQSEPVSRRAALAREKSLTR